MSTRRITADAVGIMVLAVLTGLVAWLVAILYGKHDAIWTWGLGFPVLAVCSLFAWHSDRWPTEPDAVFWCAVASIFLGVLFLAIDDVVSGSKSPGLRFRDAIWQAGSPFGIVLTIAIFPGFTLIGLAGTVRALLVRPNGTSSETNHLIR
jgi:hypothetical protein